MRIAQRLTALLTLLGFFLWDLVAASLGVARIVLSPRGAEQPAIVVMPTAIQTRWALALLAIFTSLTPGSTCLHVSRDRRRLYLHLLDGRDPDRSIARFRRLYEAPLLRLEA